MARQPKKSLTALAASLDTRKRSLPADSKPAAVALRDAVQRSKERAAAPAASREPARARPPAPPVTRPSRSDDAPTYRASAPAAPAARPAGFGVGASRASALPSLAKAPSPRPGQTPKAQPPTGAVPADSRRQYPRAGLHVRARLTLADDPRRYFDATLPTVNVSVGGLFLESTFFLKAGTVLMVEMSLPPKGRPVRVKGEVVRVETGKQSGFALRFTEYYDGSEVVLATHFLSPVLREFIVAYARTHRFDASPEYIAHTADVLAAWELKKAELGDVWTTVGEG